MPEVVTVQFAALAPMPKVCIALLVLLLFALSLATTVERIRTKTLFGTPDDPARLLTKLVRTHGNTAEYVGPLAVLIFILGTRPVADWVAGLMATAVAARLLYAVAMLSCARLDRFDPVRALAVAGTYLAGVGLGLALLIH